MFAAVADATAAADAAAAADDDDDDDDDALLLAAVICLLCIGSLLADFDSNLLGLCTSCKKLCVVGLLPVNLLTSNCEYRL